MPNQPQTKKVRPYWYLDLKWVFGLLALFTLAASLLLFNLAALTERDRATTLTATVVASLFSKDGLDDTKGLEEFRQKAAVTPGERVVPMEQFPWITVSKQQAMTLSPKDLRITIFRQITDPIYDKGLQGAATGMTADPVEQKKFVQQAALLGVFTKTTHEALQKGFYGAAILTVLFMAGVIYFSAGWGRLVSPAVLLLAVSPVGAIAGLLLLNPRTDGDAPLAALPSSVTSEIGNSLSQTYLVAAIVGMSFLLTALIGKITQKVLRDRKIQK